MMLVPDLLLTDSFLTISIAAILCFATAAGVLVLPWEDEELASVRGSLAAGSAAMVQAAALVARGRVRQAAGVLRLA